MTNSLANTANLSAFTANSVADNVAEPVTAASFYLPAWLLVGGVLLAMAIAIGILASIRSILLAKPKSRDAEFAKMICEQIWRHTDAMTGLFIQRMRQQPDDVATLRILLRYLREDMAAPLHFIGQMQVQPPENWPGFGLVSAFGNWAGQLGSIAAQLDDMQRTVPYPIPSNRESHDQSMILYQARNELQIMGQSAAKLRGYAFAICDAAKKNLEKDKKHAESHGDDDDHAHADCPCCKRTADHAPFAGPDPLNVAPLPPPPKPAPAEPKMMICHCAVPRPCTCKGGCACACACVKVSTEAHLD